MSNRESYAHRAAKSVLRGWLTSTHNPATGVCCVQVSRNGIIEDVAWNSNLPAPFGVWLEYPWDGDAMPWNEIAEREGLRFSGDFQIIPTLEEYRQRNGGRYPRAIWDIGIQHQGSIGCAFEVVWKSDITQAKREVIEGSTVTVYTVSAHWILSQTEAPALIKADMRIEPWSAP